MVETLWTVSDAKSTPSPTLGACVNTTPASLVVVKAPPAYSSDSSTDREREEPISRWSSSI